MCGAWRDGVYDDSLSDPRRTFHWLNFKLTEEQKNIMEFKNVLPNLAQLDRQINSLNDVSNGLIAKDILHLSDPSNNHALTEEEKGRLEKGRWYTHWKCMGGGGEAAAL